ncbi:nucleolar protein 12-domain-containing protein [Clohesyomyces aquaticus]|uniref:Nucleolar protein 12-domain-containing protein n=1 Tax=Clohesyomyces aquaticus TaxID=1231657 RepID=A0A1Y1YPQ7_9PLEO|nr:nucleolar protein 12-domain-containing protein [Clohesyomyces aquaticus]
MAPPSKKRKTSQPTEILFDPAAREEYLTGFHKRKLQRIKHAQEEAAKKEKEERLRFRRELRQKRKEDLEKHVSEVNMLLRKANPDLSDNDRANLDSDDDTDNWDGFEETPTAPIEPAPVDREDEYVDEDKYTTVTIESVGISKDGFEKTGKAAEDEEQDKENDLNEKKRAWTKERPKVERSKKKKKQKFRYETKAERKVTRMKQGAKNRSQAAARKSK